MGKFYFFQCLPVKLGRHFIFNPMPNVHDVMSRIKELLFFLMVFLLAGCSEYPEQSGYRIRSDFKAPLNSDTGWAAATNEIATICTDQPFRIRFETIGGSIMNNQRSSLQYRRNKGTWTKVEVAKFPKPENISILDFNEAREGPLSDLLLLIQGNYEALKVVSDERDYYLQATASRESLICLIPFDPPWKPNQLTVRFRLMEGNRNGAGIIFGFEAPGSYYGLHIDPSGTCRLSRFDHGMEQHLIERQIGDIKGKWINIEAQFTKNLVAIETDSGDEPAKFEADLKSEIAALPVGFYVPATNSADFSEFELEGSTNSPRVSIVAADVYQNGEATIDLLAVSGRDFKPGAGINYSDKSVQWPSGAVQSEWEWPLVIRRFADGAVTNDHGDIFEFRLTDTYGNQFKSAANPVIVLSLPENHVGGTFVETPGRIGPFQASNGDLYFIMEPAETDNKLMMIKSIDNGASWREVDGANRPKANDLEGLAAEMYGNTIHIIHQQTHRTWHHSFRTSDHTLQPDSWDIRDHLIATHDSPSTQVASIAIRSDGSIVSVFGGPRKVHYKIRSVDGKWGDQICTVDEGNDLILSDPQVTLGADDEVHLVYYGHDGSAWYSKFLRDGSITKSILLSSDLKPDPDATDGSILPLVYIPETNTLAVIYQSKTGYLWERRITDDGQISPPKMVSDRKVIFSAVDSHQAGADVVAHGIAVHVLFIEDGSGSIYHTYAIGNNDWQPSTLLIDGIYGSWIRGSVHLGTDRSPVYGFVYDAGSEGGGGMNKYAKLSMENFQISGM